MATHELSSLQDEVAALEHNGTIQIEPVKGSAAQRYRAFVKTGEADKGEAEAVAWASTTGAEVMFVSNDQRARAFARTHKVRAGDVLDLVIALMDVGVLPEDEARVTLAVWDEPGRFDGRPADYAGFEETVQRRRENA